MKKIGTDALKQVGLHGGYIDPSDFEMSGKVLKAGLEPTESDMISFFSGMNNSFVPYWWHLKSKNRCGREGGPACQFGSNRPALYKSAGRNSVESQLDRYIKDNLNTCLNDFDDFEDQGFDITVLGDIDPDTKVTEKEVIIVLDYEISASKAGKTTDIKSYFTKIDLNMKRIYTMANLMAQAQPRYTILEGVLLELIAVNSIPVDVNKLPPLSHQSLDPSEFLLWTRTETQEKLQSEVLVHNVPVMAVSGTKDYSKIIILSDGKVNDVASGFMSHLVWPLDEMNKTQFNIKEDFAFDTLEVEFFYSDWWPIYLNINDREVLQRNSLKNDFFPFISVNSYVFAYDVSYPVIVTISDPDAFAGDGYEFSFALEGNLRGNQPLLPDITQSSPPDPALDSLACKKNQRTSAPVNVTVVDALTDKPVDGALVEFMLGVEACYIGQTSIDETNTSSITARFPVGVGRLKVTKQGYLLYDEYLTPTMTYHHNVTVKLYPEININATVQAVTLSYAGQGKYELPRGVPISSLSPKEQAFMTLSRVSEDGDELEYSTSLIFNANQTGPSLLKIVPGEYEVDGHIMLHDRVVIPKETKKVKTSIWGGEEDIVANETVFDIFAIGGIELNNVTGYLELKEQDLLNSRQMVLYMIKFPRPVTHSTEFRDAPGLESMGEVEDYSNLYKNELDPRYIR
jgi:hypothetical protein